MYRVATHGGPDYTCKFISSTSAGKKGMCDQAVVCSSCATAIGADGADVGEMVHTTGSLLLVGR